jgi:hypothetical protein
MTSLQKPVSVDPNLFDYNYLVNNLLKKAEKQLEKGLCF